MASSSRSSAGNTRGLIEAGVVPSHSSSKRQSSAGNTRGLIEADAVAVGALINFAVFRGEYPRPH